MNQAQNRQDHLDQTLEHKNLGFDLGLHLDHLELDHDYDQLHHQRLNQQAFEPEGMLLAQELRLLVDMLLSLYLYTGYGSGRDAGGATVRSAHVG
jgi:hypothetical protein